MYFGVDWSRLKGRQRHQVITPKTKSDEQTRIIKRNTRNNKRRP